MSRADLDRPSGLERAATLPARTLVHPGPVTAHGIAFVEAPGARHLRLALTPGASLRDAVLQPLAALGVRAATARLHGGALRRLRYCVGGPDPSGAAVAAYSTPREIGAAWLIAANATVAAAADGTPLLHCHASFVDAGGAVRGGHLLTEDCELDDPAPSVFVTVLDGIELTVAFDAETAIPLIQPGVARRLRADGEELR